MGKREGDIGLFGETKWFLGKINGPLRNRWEVWQLLTKFVWVWGWLTSSLLSCDQSTSLVEKLLGKRFMTIELLLVDLPLGREGEFRESLLLHLFFFKCLQIKIINMPKHHIWGGMSWTSTVVFWGAIFCYSSHALQFS